MVFMQIKDFGTVKIELDPAQAPITVAHFEELVKAGFYDGLTFHRIIQGFMIQGGDPTGTGYGDPSLKRIKGEFQMNGVNNTLHHAPGVISMARSQNPNSASSQFFICHVDCAYLDGQYAAFGKVVEGMDVVDRVARVRTNFSDKPLEPVIIEKMYMA